VVIFAEIRNFLLKIDLILHQVVLAMHYISLLKQFYKFSQTNDEKLFFIGPMFSINLIHLGAWVVN
jgi:hypothetical protein